MKDSGIEWLGQVPAHWEVGRAGQFCTGISTGPFGTALGSQDYVTDGVPVINPSHIINGRCVPASDVTVSNETAERLSIWTLAAGDIITARRGELGRAAVVGEAEAGWICGTGSLRLRPAGNLSLSQFLFRIFECCYTREWLELSSVGSTMANINEVIMGGLPIALPLSDAEREQISLYVDYESSKIDALIIDATKAIALLRERRAALISAAVTGKIDVRAFIPTTQEAA
jgi:type I restriction enzyme S subunit